MTCCAGDEWASLSELGTSNNDHTDFVVVLSMIGSLPTAVSGHHGREGGHRWTWTPFSEQFVCSVAKHVSRPRVL